MPFLRSPLAVIAFLCLLAPCLLPSSAAAAQVVGSVADGTSDGAEEACRPVILPPMRGPQTPPSVLRRSILEALVKAEEAARLEAEAEARLAAEQDAREDSEQSLREQREGVENARAARERAETRAKALDNAVKSAVLPPAGVIPSKADWPLYALQEDPAWNGQDIAPFFQMPYSEEEILAAYRHLLDEAAHGNPRAMMVLSHAYEHWGAGISGEFSVLCPAMHSGDYWRNWAMRLTSPDWVELRLAELSLEAPEKLAHYRAAAEYSNAEALYRLSLLEDRPDLMIEAAAAGHPRACAAVAFNLSQGAGGFPASPQRAASYWWRGALAGDARSMLACSEFFYQGQSGFPKDARRAYLFALLAHETLQRQGYAPDGNDDELMPSVERRLAALAAGMGLSRDDIWSLRQELEIFRAALEEQRRSRLDEAWPAREAVLRELENDLGMVREVLNGVEGSLNERQILAKFERARADSETEQLRLGRMHLENQRKRDNSYFFWFGVVGLFAVLGGYLSLHLRLYAKVLRLMSVSDKEPI